MTYKLEFLVWSSGLSHLVWYEGANGEYSKRLIRPEGFDIKVVPGELDFYSSYTATDGRLVVRNEDRYWTDLASRAPELAAGDESYGTGFRNRKFRLSMVERGQAFPMYTGVVKDISFDSDGLLAIIECCSIQRVAQEQKCTMEKIDDVVAYADWYAGGAVEGKLYESRTLGADGNPELVFYRHKRVTAMIKRSRMPVLDYDPDALPDIDNIHLSTTDGRRTATAISLPAGYTPLGLCWGAYDENTVYVLVQQFVSPYYKLYVLELNYATGEIEQTTEAASSGTGPYSASSVSLFYNKYAATNPRVYACVFDFPSPTADCILIEYDTSDRSAQELNLSTGYDIRDFLFFAPGRGFASPTTPRGTLWVLAGDEDNSIQEYTCWDIAATWVKLNDSAMTYKLLKSSSPDVYWWLQPAACTTFEKHAREASHEAYTADMDVYLYRGYGELPMAHDTNPGQVVLCAFQASVWQPLSVLHETSPDDKMYYHGEMLEVPDSAGADARGLIFTRICPTDDSLLMLCSKQGGDYGSNDIYDIQDCHFHRFCRAAADLTSARVYYCTAKQGTATGTPPVPPDDFPFNSRLRSLNGNDLRTASAQDENVNPSGGSCGDPITDLAMRQCFGRSLVVRGSGDTHEVHGLLYSPQDDPVLFSYSKDYYPTIPYVDLIGLNIHEFRSKLAILANAYHNYNEYGQLAFKAFPTGAASGYWPDGTLRLKSLGWKDVINSIVAIPFRMELASERGHVELQQSSTDAASTGRVSNAHVAIDNIETILYKVVFSGTATYVVFRLVSEVWTLIGSPTGIDATFRDTGEPFTLTPDCFAGDFVAGDTFVFKVFPTRWQLTQEDQRNRYEVEDATSVAKWQRQSLEFTNRFFQRSKLPDVLDNRLAWLKDPHRRFGLVVSVDESVTMLEQRYATFGDETPSTMLIGIKYKTGDPVRTLELLEL